MRLAKIKKGRTAEVTEGKGGTKDCWDSGLEGCRKGGSGMMQYRKDAAQEGFGTGTVQV